MSCPDSKCDIAGVTVQSQTCASGFKRFTNGLKCFNVIDGAINLYCALKDIATAIREYTEVAEQKGYASALLHFRISGEDYANGEIKNFQLSRVPFNYKVTGFGVSCLSFPTSGGAYSDDDNLNIKLYDFTGSNQVGQTLSLNQYQLHDQHSDLGQPIGNNIGSGHIFGIKIEHTAEDSGSFSAPDVDVYIHIEPTELVTVL